MTDANTSRPPARTKGRIHLQLDAETENFVQAIQRHYEKDGIRLSTSAVARMAILRLASRLPGV